MAELIGALYLVTFLWLLCRACDCARARQKIAEAIGEQLDCRWWSGREAVRRHLHPDQSACGPLPPLPRSLRAECLEIHMRPKGPIQLRGRWGRNWAPVR